MKERVAQGDQLGVDQTLVVTGQQVSRAGADHEVDACMRRQLRYLYREDLTK